MLLIAEKGGIFLKACRPDNQLPPGFAIAFFIEARGSPGLSAQPLQQLPPVLAQLARGSDMPVQRLPGDAELAA